MVHILFVCHGNICRSPMAEFVMRDLAAKAGVAVVTASAATSDEEIGNPVHPGTRHMLAQYGIRCNGKTARRLTRADYDDYDYLIAMDRYNLRNMRAMLGGDPQGKTAMLLSYCGEMGDVADPWYTGDFESTWRDVNRGCRALLAFIQNNERRLL